MLPLDLHVLSLSLAFILSQDQTLHCNISIALVYPARMIYIALIGFYYILLTVPDPYSRRNPYLVLHLSCPISQRSLHAPLKQNSVLFPKAVAKVLPFSLQTKLFANFFTKKSLQPHYQIIIKRTKQQFYNTITPITMLNSIFSHKNTTRIYQNPIIKARGNEKNKKNGNQNRY